MRRRLFGILATLSVLLGVAVAVPATTDAACSHMKLVFAERQLTSTAPYGDQVTICYTSMGGVTNLKNVAHTQSGYCDSHLIIHLTDSWEDCVDIFFSDAPEDDGNALTFDACVVGYMDPNASGTVLFVESRSNDGSWQTLVPNDNRLSSVKWGHRKVVGSTWSCDTTP